MLAKTLKAEADSPAVHDAVIIAAAQRVEHFEIAGYGCARTLAQRELHEWRAQDTAEERQRGQEKEDRREVPKLVSGDPGHSSEAEEGCGQCDHQKEHS
jgi:hypothetical protein